LFAPDVPRWNLIAKVIPRRTGADALLSHRQSARFDYLRFPDAGTGRAQLYEKIARSGEYSKYSLRVRASRGDIEEKLRPAVGGGVEDFVPKPFFVVGPGAADQEIIDRLHLEKMQKHASRLESSRAS